MSEVFANPTMLHFLLILYLESAWSKWSPDHAETTIVKPYKMTKALHMTPHLWNWKNGFDRNVGNYWDFESKSFAARLETEYPMKIPKRFTWCTKYKSKIYQSTFTVQTSVPLFQIGTTVHGESVIKDLINPKMLDSNITHTVHGTYKVLFGAVLINSHYRPEIQFFTGNIEGRWTLAQKLLFRWQKWDSACFGVDLEGKDGVTVVIYYNGQMFGNVFEDEASKRRTHTAVNESFFDTPTATDVWIGWGLCDSMTFNLFGYLTETHMFNRILSHDEMVSMTDCSKPPLPNGAILNWSSLNYTFYGGPYVPEIMIPDDLLCPDENKKGFIYVPQAVFLLNDAHTFCKRLGAEVVSFDTIQEFQEAAIFSRSVTEDYQNKYQHDEEGWGGCAYAGEGGGIQFWSNLIRNRTNNDYTDPFYSSKTGVQNQFVRS